MTRALRVLGLVMPVVMGIAWFHLFGPTTAWTTPVHWVISGLLAAGALATAVAGWRGMARLHVGIAAGLLAAQAAIIACTLAGVRLIAFDLFPDRRLAIVIGAALGLAVYGLLRRRMWARGLGLALGAVGALSGGLNALHYWSVTDAPNPEYLEWSMEMYVTAWVMLVSALGGALVALNLASPAVREAFAAHTRDTAWTSDHRVIRPLRAMIITAFAAVPMLLVYAWLQPIVPATQPTALVLAALLALGGVLATRGKVIGALLLVFAGAGLLAQTAATALAAAPDDRGIAGYYAVFWLPAALVALACGVRLAGPAWRLLRR